MSQAKLQERIGEDVSVLPATETSEDSSLSSEKETSDDYRHLYKICSSAEEMEKEFLKSFWQEYGCPELLSHDYKKDCDHPYITEINGGIEGEITQEMEGRTQSMMEVLSEERFLVEALIYKNRERTSKGADKKTFSKSELTADLLIDEEQVEYFDGRLSAMFGYPTLYENWPQNIFEKINELEETYLDYVKERAEWSSVEESFSNLFLANRDVLSLTEIFKEHQGLSEEGSQTATEYNERESKTLHERLDELEREYSFFKEFLIRHCFQFAYGSARKKEFSDKVEFDDLVQSAKLGLFTAADIYSSEYDTSFLTYAGYWVDREIMKTLQESSGEIVTTPRDGFTEFHKAVKEIKDEGGDCTLENIAEKTGMSEKKIGWISDAYALYKSNLTTSLDEALSNCEGSTSPYSEIISGDADVFEEYSEEESFRLLRETIDNLFDERESDIIKTRFGIGGREKKTLRELGEKYDVVKERIRQIQEEALKELRKTEILDELRRGISG